MGITRLDECGLGEKLKVSLAFFPFLCTVLFREAESLRVSDCDLASGVANVIYKGSWSAFSLLLCSVSL